MATEKQPSCWHTVDQHTGTQVQHKPLLGSSLIPIKEHRNSFVRFSNFSSKSRSFYFYTKCLSYNVDSNAHENTHLQARHSLGLPVYCCKVLFLKILNFIPFCRRKTQYI